MVIKLLISFILSIYFNDLLSISENCHFPIPQHCPSFATRGSAGFEFITPPAVLFQICVTDAEPTTPRYCYRSNEGQY